MTMNFKRSCLVLDLDDTLYPEIDYQTSGLRFVESELSSLYGMALDGFLVALRDKGVKDVFSEACRLLNMPDQLKESLVWLYRMHDPVISLNETVKSFIKESVEKFKAVVILTDGRAISQRKKIRALGLNKLSVFISEEWDSCKPDSKRFIEIMGLFSDCCDSFCYVGDNPSKDFLAPNELAWISVCLKGSDFNIHTQETNHLSAEYHPAYWISDLNEIFNLC